MRPDSSPESSPKNATGELVVIVCKAAPVAGRTRGAFVCRGRVSAMPPSLDPLIAMSVVERFAMGVAQDLDVSDVRTRV